MDKQKQYQVNRLEVYSLPVRIMASSAEEALKKVLDGEGDIREDELEYRSSLDSSEFPIYEIPDDGGGNAN